MKINKRLFAIVLAFTLLFGMPASAYGQPVVPEEGNEEELLLRTGFQPLRFVEIPEEEAVGDDLDESDAESYEPGNIIQPILNTENHYKENPRGDEVLFAGPGYFTGELPAIELE